MKYIVKIEGHNLKYRVYRKAPSSEFNDSLIASCAYAEHADLVAEALNKNQKRESTRLKHSKI